MFILSNFISSIARLLQIVFPVFYLLIFVRCILSWVNPDPSNPFVQFVHKTTEPLLAPIRRLFPIAWGIGIDLSPLLAFLILKFLEFFLIRTLFDLATRIS